METFIRKVNFNKIIPQIFFICFTFILTGCGGNEDYAKTKYPIVMVPGAFSFDNALGIVDYWYGITDELRDNGAEVYVVNLSSSGAHEVRGEELLADIAEIRAISGADKVNLFAHSQGATASRYVSAIRPEWIASVSCSHCMNEGTHFADYFDQVLEDTGLNIIVEPALGVLFDILQLAASTAKDGDFNSNPRPDQNGRSIIEASLHATYDQFNATYPAAMPTADCDQLNNGLNGATGGGAPIANGIRFYSWGGVEETTSLIDPLDLLAINAANLFVPDEILWDGLVPGCGMALGEFLKGDYNANHFDAINQAFGITDSDIDIPALFTAQANRVKKAGF